MMKTFKKIGVCGVSLILLMVSGYLYLFQNRYLVFDDISYVSVGEDVIQYRYDTINGYVGLDITLNTLKANDSSVATIASNTKKLQEAMNKVSDAGGGTVYLPSGTFYFGRGGMNSKSDQEDFAIKCRNNVHLKGAGTDENSSSYTVLKPVYDNPSGSGGMDMFYFNNYKDTGFGASSVNTSTVKDVSYIDNDGNTVTWKNQTVYLVNADFSDFVIDGDNARGGIATAGGTYRTDGKGFMINLFMDCDWDNVVVKNVDATGFGVDCPINSTIKNCKAINCGKAATSTDGGASGFGIGTGFSNNESLVIDNCIALNNKKYGFFFEHQARFSAVNYLATKSTGFVVSNSIAGGNLYDFGGLKSYDVTYENNKSVSNNSTYKVSGLATKNTSAGTYKYSTISFTSGKLKLNIVKQPIDFSSYSVNSFVTNTNIYSMLTDVNSNYTNEVKWAVNSGIIPVSSASTFGSNTAVTRWDVVQALFAYKGYPGSVVADSTSNMDRTKYKNLISSIGYSDLSGASYQDELDAVVWAYNNGIISKDTKFYPENNCSRAMLVTMLYRLAGSPSVSGTVPFTDVSEGKWYYNAVVWGYNKGIIKGTAGSTFAPDDNVTKIQLAIFLYRFKTSGSNSYTIKYNLNGGSASNIATYTSSTSYTLKNPTKIGFIFTGWTGSNGTTPSKSVTIKSGTTGNLTYTANWSPNLTNIFVKSMPSKTVYKVGDTLDLTGLVIGAKYGDNNIKEITGYTVTPKTLSTDGTQEITVSYGGLTTSFNVTVNKVDVSKISISSKPSKLNYYVGDIIDTTGLVLKVTYSDDSSKNISSGFTVSPTTLNTSGTQKITVKYGEKSTSYSVDVNEVSLSAIEIKTMPSRTTYFEGEIIDTSGLILLAKYDNGTTKEITAGYSVDVSRANKVGSQTVTITYKKKTTTFKVDVKEVSISSIRVKELPKQINYFVGDVFSSNGLTLGVFMNSSYEEEVNSGYSLSIDEGYKFTSKGSIEVKVNYKDFTTSFTINVYDYKEEVLTITNRPDKTIFVVGEEFTTEGLILEVVSGNGDRKTISDGYTLSFAEGKVLENAGVHNITITYNDKSVVYTIVTKKVTKIIINDMAVKNSYKVGDTIDTSNLIVICEYSDGVKEELTSEYRVEVEGGNTFTSAGNKVVTIKYGDVESQYIVSVEDSSKSSSPNLIYLVIIAFIVGGIIAFLGLKDRFFNKKVTAGRLFK